MFLTDSAYLRDITRRPTLSQIADRPVQYHIEETTGITTKAMLSLLSGTKSVPWLV
jgi:hypothetical protein